MARFEVITGADRQRHWSKDDKLSILREAFSPGAVVTVVARRHDIRVQQIYYWRKKFSVSKQAPVFLPVSVFDSELPIVGGAQAEAVTHMVIPPFLTGFARRIYAANFSFCAGVMPPMPMLGRSLL